MPVRPGGTNAAAMPWKAVPIPSRPPGRPASLICAVPSVTTARNGPGAAHIPLRTATRWASRSHWINCSMSAHSPHRAAMKRRTTSRNRSAPRPGRWCTAPHIPPRGQQKPLDKLFNVGPFAAPGGHETPNNLSQPVGPAPWSVVYGPSTRRLIDLADAGSALGINPVGQSGVLFDRHYKDQADAYMRGEYVPMHLDAEAIKANSRSQLILRP